MSPKISAIKGLIHDYELLIESNDFSTTQLNGISEIIITHIIEICNKGIK
jgi:hypothetical protein